MDQTLPSSPPEKKKENHQIPEGFVKKGRMIVLAVDQHAFLNKRGKTADKFSANWASMSFLVNKVPPAPDRLPQNNAGRRHIRYLPKMQALPPDIKITADYSSQQSPVDGQTPVPDADHLQKIALIQLPGKNHIIESCPDKSQGPAASTRFKICSGFKPAFRLPDKPDRSPKQGQRQ